MYRPDSRADRGRRVDFRDMQRPSNLSDPSVRIVGVQAEACPSALEAVDTGERVTVGALRSIADGITVKQIGRTTFDIIRKAGWIRSSWWTRTGSPKPSSWFLNEKRCLPKAQGQFVWPHCWDAQSRLRPGTKAVLVISGGNMDISLLDRVIRKGMSRNGRIMRFSVCLDDVPGALEKGS